MKSEFRGTSGQSEVLNANEQVNDSSKSDKRQADNNVTICFDNIKSLSLVDSEQEFAETDLPSTHSTDNEIETDANIYHSNEDIKQTVEETSPFTKTEQPISHMKTCFYQQKCTSYKAAILFKVLKSTTNQLLDLKQSFDNMTVIEGITPEQQNVIDELKRRTINAVSPKMLEDELLFYRFAKARDFDLADAEAMIRKSKIFREELKIDKLLTDYKPPANLVKYVPTQLLCFDKEGCAVRYVDGGRVDAKGLWNLAKKQDLLKYFAYRIEQDAEKIFKNSAKPKKAFYLPIFNMEELAYSTVTHMKTLQYCLYFLKCYVDNFPERLKCAVVINAPFYFLWAFSVFKQVLPATIIQKIRIFGRDGWKECLQEFIDADDLPAFLGGNRTDPNGNPQCKTFVKWGEPIPKRCYMRTERKQLASVSDSEKVSIMPFSKEEISFEVNEENSELEWEFETKNRDIDFSMYFKEAALEESQPLELIPKQRVDTCYETEKGLFKCEKIGTYTIVFDNSYSWVYTKELYYRASVKSPNGNDQWI
ncbi:SEC14-like protein 2 [Araneus ventricosus]|uniref:SEC14-like protein 2 n=1 Tax=Araneus ventricosus TaxID=182803 RepID=A0A4Y2AB43_ARAVE|nr:SEC14-like protein 2 [Araneus ventricosus]